MANRHLARSVVLQTLFEWDTTHTMPTGKQASAKNASDILARNVAEFGGEDVDQSFMDNLLAGVLAKKGDIDLVISKAAPEWPLDKITALDRNILRLGIYEMMYEIGEVPPKVIINEAVELAKELGSEKSYSFVNAVLGKIYDTKT